MSKDKNVEHIFAPNGGYCVYYPSNRFHNVHSFENWREFLCIPQIQLRNIGLRDVFRPIPCERKYLNIDVFSNYPLEPSQR